MGCLKCPEIFKYNNSELIIKFLGFVNEFEFF